MIIVPIIEYLVCFLILKWLIRQKTGEPFSKKAIVKFLLLGAISVVAVFAVMLPFPIEADTFFHFNPLINGFLTALLTAALAEEVMKYFFFRLAIRKNSEVSCWLDAVIAAVIVAIGFTLLEDLSYLFDGAKSVLRVILPGHLLFQAVMGYYYGKARVTKQFKYDILSLVVPILLHTGMDMFLIALMSIFGSPQVLNELTESNITAEKITALPYYNWMIPLLICAFAMFIVILIGLILMAGKISRWSRNGELQEKLH